MVEVKKRHVSRYGWTMGALAIMVAILVATLSDDAIAPGRLLGAIFGSVLVWLCSAILVTLRTRVARALHDSSRARLAALATLPPLLLMLTGPLVTPCYLCTVGALVGCLGVTVVPFIVILHQKDSKSKGYTGILHVDDTDAFQDLALRMSQAQQDQPVDVGGGRGGHWSAAGDSDGAEEDDEGEEEF